MKKTILTSIAAIAFAMPAIAANIPNNATCNSDVLGVSSGSANLEADYTANTINITWDGNGGSTPTGGASSCTYDSTFNLPAAPTKTGYTFAGWAVQAQCGLATLNADTKGVSYLSRSLDNTRCFNYNTTGSSISGCEDNIFSELSVGEWQANFSYGNIKGIAKCSSTNGTYAQTGIPSDENGQYCWCQVSAYTPNGGSQCNVSTTSWVFGDADIVEGNCAKLCADDCAYEVQAVSNFRRALFGLN